jgi:hypothetical protein
MDVKLAKWRGFIRVIQHSVRNYKPRNGVSVGMRAKKTLIKDKTYVDSFEKI